MIRRLDEIIESARQHSRIKNGLVLCDNCDTPAVNALCLSDEDLRMVIEALVEAEWSMKRDAEIDHSIRRDARAEVSEKAAAEYAAVRRRLEVIHADEH